MLKQNINYQQIFRDILDTKCPEKKEECQNILQKQTISGIDIIELNQKIFGNIKENENFNQKHRSYNKLDILKILDYQKKHRLNNSQLANHFGLSRNSVTKWKKMFLT